jgi:conjugative transfer signal peptidase TraF
VLTLATVALALLALASSARMPSYLVWNASASVPLGLYLMSPNAPIGRHDLVLAWLPDAMRQTAAERRYLPADVPIIKPVAAIFGDIVCAGTDGISINEKVIAKRLAHDRQGRLMPTWLGCKTLRDNELLLLAPGVTDSFDGRYFGPLDLSQVVGTVVPLWTF